VPGPFDPQALNRYSYVRNNPVVLTDPSGHFFTSIISTAIAAASAAPLWVQMTVASGISTDWNLELMALQQGIAMASAATAVFTGGASLKLGAYAIVATMAWAAAGAATSAALYDLAGYDVNYGQSILTGMAISAVTFGGANPWR